MTIVVSVAGSFWRAGATYIGYENILQRADAVVVPTTEVADFEVANLISWNGAQVWKAAAGGTQRITISFPVNVDVNSWGVYRHNFGALGAGVTVEAEYSTDGSSWTTLGSQVAPAVGDFSTLFQIHGSTVMADFFRLSIVGATGNPIIANLFFGESLLVFGSPETGWVPPSVAFEDKFINNVSETGNFVGRSLIRKAMQTQFSISVVEANWVFANWEPLLQAVQAHPFYFSWDSANFPTDVAYCWTEGRIGKPAFSAPNHMTISLNFRAIVDQVTGPT